MSKGVWTMFYLDPVDKLPIVENIPGKVEMPFMTICGAQVIQDMLNDKYIGVVLYCLHCGIPLRYYYYDDKLVLKCPKCGAEWHKDVNWERSSKYGKRKYKSLRTRISKD